MTNHSVSVISRLFFISRAGLLIVSVAAIWTLLGLIVPALSHYILYTGHALILFIGLLVAGIRYRDSRPDGRITFRAAFGLGVGITLVVSAVDYGWYHLYLNYIDPDLLPRLNRELDRREANLILRGFDSRKIETTFNTFRYWFRIETIAIVGSLLNLPAGTVFSLITAFFIRRTAVYD